MIRDCMMPQKKILLVYDDAFILSSLSRELRIKGFYLTPVHDTLEARQRIMGETYDLIIYKLALSEDNEIELLLDFKKNVPEIGIILLCAEDTVGTARNIVRSGLDDYLVNPCHFDELYSRICRCLEMKELLQHLESQEIALEKERKETLRLREEMQQRAEKVKRLFCSIAHDLKVPLISILGLARYLDTKFKHLLPAKGKKYCKQIQNDAWQTLKLVEHITSFGSTRNSQLKVEEIRLEQLVKEAREDFEPTLSGRNIQWLASGNLPVIRADRLALLRVFRNLFDNALKYGGERLTEISIEYNHSPSCHFVSVMNNGIGLAHKDCHTIFTPFIRKHTSSTAKGMGLGLSIVKEIIEGHKGEVWAEPGLPHGVTFYLSIPKEL